MKILFLFVCAEHKTHLWKFCLAFFTCSNSTLSCKCVREEKRNEYNNMWIYDPHGWILIRFIHLSSATINHAARFLLCTIEAESQLTSLFAEWLQSHYGTSEGFKSQTKSWQVWIFVLAPSIFLARPKRREKLYRFKFAVSPVSHFIKTKLNFVAMMIAHVSSWPPMPQLAAQFNFNKWNNSLRRPSGNIIIWSAPLFSPWSRPVPIKNVSLFPSYLCNFSSFISCIQK